MNMFNRVLKRMTCCWCFCILGLCMLLGTTDPVYAQGTYSGMGYGGVGEWSTPIYCHLLNRDDGSVTLLYTEANGSSQSLYARTISQSGSVLSSKTTSVPGKDWGGCLYDDNAGNHYVASGNNGQVGWYFTKFNPSWEKMGTAEVRKSDSYTTEAFDAGNCDMAMVGKYLIAHAARKREDGHQDSVSFYIDTESMRVVYAGPQWQFNHCSHSFNQFVRTSGNEVLMVDHGDSFPRSVNLQYFEFPTNSENMSEGYQNYYQSKPLMKIWGKTGDNNTGVTVDGFELGKNSDLIAGTSIPHGSFRSNEEFDEYYDGNDVYLLVVSKNHATFRQIWLTNYNSDTEVINLQLIKVNDDKFYIVYQKSENTVNQEICVITVNSNGTVLARNSYPGRMYCLSNAIASENGLSWFYYTDSKLGESLTLFTWDLSAGKITPKYIDAGKASKISKLTGTKKLTVAAGKKENAKLKIHSSVFKKGIPDGYITCESNAPDVAAASDLLIPIGLGTQSGDKLTVKIPVKGKKAGKAVITCRICDKSYKIKVTVSSSAKKTKTVKGQNYKILTGNKVAFIKAKNTKNVTVPATVKIKGKTYKVTQVNAGAFSGSKIRTVTIGKNVVKLQANCFKGSRASKLIIKTKKLTKKSVKGSLKGSKIKRIQVKAGSKKVNKTYAKRYKKYFSKKNAGKKVTVK